MNRIDHYSTARTAVLLLTLITTSLLANHIWYQNENNIRPVYPTSVGGGTYTTSVDNPDSNSDTKKVAQFNRTGEMNPSVTFKLPNPITDFSSLTIALNIHVDETTENLDIHSNKVRLYLKNSAGAGSSLYLQERIAEGKTWEELQFDFSGESTDPDVVSGGGYDELSIAFSTGVDNSLTTSYYIDYITGTQIQSPAKVLGGNWGITFPVSPAKGSDYDYAAGAREIVAELGTIGHVITNFTGFAHGQYFTLHTNLNVDIAAEIHESSVPGIENDGVMEEVLSIFREAGIKTILYMALDGYHNFNATDEQKASWENYYTTKFNGDEYAAYKNLMMGFVERTKDMCDGYWLDHTTKLPENGTTTDFVASIREIHPDAMISLNDTKAWLTTGPQEWVKVDSDGLDDEDSTDYLIVTHESRNYRSDFTSGHVTPIGQGAPVNSWAYEEFTIPNMIENPWTTYNDFTSMKHAWFPVRERWHVPTLDLVQEVEQAYRFVRRVTDAGASITWATTAEYRVYERPGHLMPDELEMMKEINRRMALSPKPDYEPYVRPEGAYLVGEDPVAVAGTGGGTGNTALTMSFRNRALHFNQNLAKASVFSVNGRRVVDVDKTGSAIGLKSLSKGIYIVNLELESGAAQSFRFMMK